MKLKNCAFVALMTIITFSSCISTKKTAYFQDLPTDYAMDIVRANVPKIAPNDILSIKVSSSKPELVIPFNLDQRTSYNQQLQERQIDGYVVGSNGMVNFPVIGEIQAAGMTREEFARSLQEKLKAYLPDPVVIASYVNFKVTVLGEVMRPGPVTVLNDRITLLEAIGMAGDLSVYGKRNNVLVIREQADGQRVFAKVDLQSKNLFSSPYYYMQQNDVIYVEPVKAKAEQASSFRNNLPLVLSVGSLLTSLAMMFVAVYK